VDPVPNDVATESEWRALASPRPEPLPGAVRLAFAGIELPDAPPSGRATPVSSALGLSELVVAGLLRRRDVEFVERRRFAVAVEAEQSGLIRPSGAPPAGVSRGAELIATAALLPLPGGQAAVEVRLTGLQTGVVAGAGRQLIPADAEQLGTARAIVATILSVLDEMGRRPAWADPVPGAAPGAYRPTGIPESAVTGFLTGLAAEERWNWELARRSYQAASETEGFFEPATALARTARLRSGGTLGES